MNDHFRQELIDIQVIILDGNSNTLRTRAGKNAFVNEFKFAAAVDLNKCLNLIIIPISL